MPERPAVIKRLDALFSAAMIAHEAIFEMRRELIANDRGNAEQAGLLEESAQIVTGKLPGLTARVRQGREAPRRGLKAPSAAGRFAPSVPPSALATTVARQECQAKGELPSKEV